MDNVRRLNSEKHLDGDAECLCRLIKSGTERFVTHCHDYYEVFLITKGTAVHESNGHRRHLQSGSLVFVRKDDIHAYKDYGEFEFVNLAFSEATFMGLYDYLGCAFPYGLLINASYSPEVRLLENETRKLYMKLAELNTVNFSDKAMLKLKTRAVLAEIFTKYFLNIPQKQSEIPFWLENAYEKMKKPENFIEGRERFFEFTGKTAEHTSRCMKKYYGMTPSEYVIQLRLTYAANLFFTSNLNAAEICFECGFENLSWFYTNFSKKYGVSPAKYRKMQNIILDKK